MKDLVQIYESFFNRIHMHRAITLNSDKVKEALDIISLFGTQGSNYETDEEFAKRLNKARQKMKEY